MTPYVDSSWRTRLRWWAQDHEVILSIAVPIFIAGSLSFLVIHYGSDWMIGIVSSLGALGIVFAKLFIVWQRRRKAK